MRAISLACSIASVAVILWIAAQMRAHGSDDAAAFAVICLSAVLASLLYHERHMEKMRRGREILDRYNPERRPRPLGI
jgi:hypothetical protein